MALLDTFIKILKKGEKEQAIITKDRLPSDELTIGKSAITFKSIDDKNIEAFNTALKQEGYKGPGINLNKIGKILSEKGILSKDNFNVLFINDFCKYSLATSIDASRQVSIRVSCVLSELAILKLVLTCAVVTTSVDSAVTTVTPAI